jgi:hypothetical protein
MKKNRHVLAFLLLFTIASSCSQESEEDLVQTPNKNGSVEMKIEVLHQNGIDVIKTTKDVWVKNNLINSFVNFDTVPSLGDTTEIIEEADGNTKAINVPKDYEIYITVK